MSTPAILAKAIFDNLADASDELSFRKGDIVTVIEQDVDGLIGWWLCSLHGRQGIAPGNRLQQIKRRDEGEDQVQSAEVFTFEDVDYDTPRSQEEGEDYDVPRGIMSPDYDIPTDNELVDYAVPKGFVKDSGLIYLTGQEAESESQQLYDVPISDPLLKESEQKLADNVQFIVNTEERLPEDIYDIPQHNASEVQGVFIQQNNQRDFAHLDQTKEAVGELYDVPNKEASVKEMYSQQPVIVKEDKELYAEIYDVPTQTEQDNRNSLERHLKGTPAPNDGSVNVRVQEKRDSRELAKLRKPANAVGHLSISSSDGDRQSTSSTDSGKVGFEDDDYVDYQEIYGDGKENDVNVYDVPVQPIPLSQDKDIRNSPSTKRTQVSILQQINMKAVKGVNLDPAVALQRLTKLEQAVNGTAQKLLRFVTTTWRDPTILKSHLADIRDTTGKAKVALRLLTEFALSSLVSARSLPTQELSGKLSRAVEPLLETYYSVKLALQRLDDQDWRTPLEKSSSTHDDLDLIMVHIRSVPENSHKLAGIIRTGATTLYKKKPSLASELTSTSSQTKRPAANKAAQEKTNTSDLNSTRSGEIAVSPITGASKETADGNVKAKGDGSKWSPTTLRWVCGVDNRNGDGFGVNGSEGSAVPRLPSRLQSSYDKTKNGVSSEEPRTPPLPPQRKDSGKKCHHLRQKSLEKFPTDGLGNEAPGPPPKPKLDRKRTARKSYKVPLFAERKQMQEEVVLREHKGSETEPSTPRRKCNSDPSQLKESISSDMSPVEKPTETTNILQIRKQSSVHVSDSDLPQSLKESNKVRSMASQFEKVENSSVSSQRAVHDVLEHRPLSNLIKGVDLTNGVMVSLNDRELLEFYKYEIDAQLFVLSEAIKGFFAVVDRNESPKVFVSNSKFIVLSAHKFVYIGDTLSKKISDSDLRSDVISVTNKLSGGIKMLVSATKSAALQYPASSAMREMSDSVLVVNDNAIELHRIVKKTTN